MNGFDPVIVIAIISALTFGVSSAIWYKLGNIEGKLDTHISQHAEVNVGSESRRTATERSAERPGGANGD